MKSAKMIDISFSMTHLQVFMFSEAYEAAYSCVGEHDYRKHLLMTLIRIDFMEVILIHSLMKVYIYELYILVNVNEGDKQRLREYDAFFLALVYYGALCVADLCFQIAMLKSSICQN